MHFLSQPSFPASPLDNLDYYQVPLAILLGGARAVGFVAIHPLFSWLQIDVRLRLAIAVGLSGKLIAGLLASGQLEEFSLLFISALAVKEILIGLCLGLVLGLPIYGMQAAGDLIDFVRGGLAADHLDPMSASAQSDTARVLSVLALLWLIMSGAFTISIDILMESFALIPMQNFDIDLSWNAAIGLLHGIFEYGYRFAFPLFVLMFVIDFAWGMAAMGERSIQATEIGNSAKSLVLMIGLPIYLVALVALLGAEFQTVLSLIQEFLRN